MHVFKDADRDMHWISHLTLQMLSNWFRGQDWNSASNSDFAPKFLAVFDEWWKNMFCIFILHMYFIPEKFYSS